MDRVGNSVEGDKIRFVIPKSEASAGIAITGLADGTRVEEKDFAGLEETDGACGDLFVEIVVMVASEEEAIDELDVRVTVEAGGVVVFVEVMEVVAVGEFVDVGVDARGVLRSAVDGEPRGRGDFEGLLEEPRALGRGELGVGPEGGFAGEAIGAVVDLTGGGHLVVVAAKGAASREVLEAFDTFAGERAVADEITEEEVMIRAEFVGLFEDGI